MLPQDVGLGFVDDAVNKGLQNEVIVGIRERVKNMIASMAAGHVLVPQQLQQAIDGHNMPAVLLRRLSLISVSVGLLFAAGYFDNNILHVAQDDSLLLLVANLGFKIVVMQLKSAFKDRLLHQLVSLRRGLLLYSLSKSSVDLPSLDLPFQAGA